MSDFVRVVFNLSPERNHLAELVFLFLSEKDLLCDLEE